MIVYLLEVGYRRLVALVPGPLSVTECLCEALGHRTLSVPIKIFQKIFMPLFEAVKLSNTSVVYYASG